MPVTCQKVCVGAVGGCKPILVFSLGQAEQLKVEELENNASLKGTSALQQIDSVSAQTDEIFLCHKCFIDEIRVYKFA